MGYLSALDFAENADLDTALRWHLTANHFPPLPIELLPAAKEAIANAAAEDWDAPVDLRGVATYREGATAAPTWACVEGWHLEAFLAADDAITEDEELVKARVAYEEQLELDRKLRDRP